MITRLTFTVSVEQHVAIEYIYHKIYFFWFHHGSKLIRTKIFHTVSTAKHWEINLTLPIRINFIMDQNSLFLSLPILFNLYMMGYYWFHNVAGNWEIKSTLPIRINFIMDPNSLLLSLPILFNLHMMGYHWFHNVAGPLNRDSLFHKLT